MKQLSVEEKAKCYDEAIERAIAWRKKYVNSTISEDGTMIQDFDNIFPELKESEDEKIRKRILFSLQKDVMATKNSGCNTKDLEECIAYLEKQGEHANFLNKIQIGDKVTRNQDGVLVNLSQLKRIAKKDEKQGEQKPYGQREECSDCEFSCGDKCVGSCAMKRGEQKPADEVEPKFKVGDIIRLKDGDGLEWTVEKVFNTGYYTIVCADRDDFIQLDDNWELVEQKPSWSEEDEDIVGNIIRDLKRLSGDMVSPNQTYKKEIQWLKSLKERYTWKPSDKQMKVLTTISSKEIFSEYERGMLVGLYTELKKLREG